MSDSTKSLVKSKGPGRPKATLAETKNQREAFLENLRASLNVYKSAQAAGISRSTVYLWRERWSSFKDAWEEAKRDARDNLIGKIQDLGDDPDTADHVRLGAYKFLLQVHFPEDFDRMGAIKTTVDPTSGKTEIVIATAAPGVMDRLLDGSPYRSSPEDPEDPGDQDLGL